MVNVAGPEQSSEQQNQVKFFCTKPFLCRCLALLRRLIQLSSRLRPNFPLFSSDGQIEVYYFLIKPSICCISRRHDERSLCHHCPHLLIPHLHLSTVVSGYTHLSTFFNRHLPGGNGIESSQWLSFVTHNEAWLVSILAATISSTPSTPFLYASHPHCTLFVPHHTTLGNQWNYFVQRLVRIILLFLSIGIYSEPNSDAINKNRIFLFR